MGKLFRLHARKTVQVENMSMIGDYRYEGSERDVTIRKKELKKMNVSPYSDVRYDNIVIAELPEGYTKKWIQKEEKEIQELEKKLQEKKRELQKKRQLLKTIKSKT